MSSPARRRLAPGLTPGGAITAPCSERGILLHQHRVGAGRQRGAGQDAQGRTRRQAALERMPGGGALREQPERRRPILGEVAMGEGEAVDRDVVEPGHVALGDHRLGEDPAVGGGERHALRGDHRPDAPLEQRQRLARRQALAVVGEAVVERRFAGGHGSRRAHVTSQASAPAAPGPSRPAWSAPRASG